MADDGKSAKPKLKPLSFDGKCHDVQQVGMGVNGCMVCVALYLVFHNRHALFCFIIIP